MKTTKDLVYGYVEKAIYTQGKQSKGVETKEVADALDMQRSNVSSLLNDLVKEGRLHKISTRPVLYTLPQDIEQGNENPFHELIGANGSLKRSIQLAQAAILYPKKSLNVLLSSKKGCGTSSFVYAMHRFAINNGVLKKDSPFIKINCRHFAKNISLLNEELFGVNEIKDSAFYRAQGGMLFIDNIDLLDGRQQSQLFDFLEHGQIYSENLQKVVEFKNVFLVLSCSLAQREEHESRVPMIITLPELKDRELRERYELINHFFQVEAVHSDCVVEVSAEVVQSLLMTDFQYNIKELAIEIKAACANAYVRSVNDQEKEIYVCLEDFKNKISKSLFRLKEIEPEIATMIGAVDKLIYDKSYKIEDNRSKDSDLYSEIKRQYDELAKRGISKSSIKDVIDTHIQILFEKYQYEHESSDAQEMDRLAKIVDPRVIEIVSSFIRKYRDKSGKEIQKNVFYGLCLHINSLLTLSMGHQRVDNQQVVELIQNYPQEYAASVELAQNLKEVLKLELPIEEVTIIALFLIETETAEDISRPVLLYILHGSETASSLRDVTNSLTHCQNAYSYDLALEIETSQALEEIKELILKIDQGQGVLVIYDMGSIKTMLDTISESIDVKIRYMNIPITLVGIDVARKCSMEPDLDYVYHMANLEVNKLNRNTERHRDVIITLCHTGDGGAIQLKHYISQYSKLGMKIVPLAISSREDLLKEVMSLKKTYNIHAFVGTYDPKLLGIPFIPIDKVFENRREDLDRILMFEPVQMIGVKFEEIYNYLNEQFKYTSISKLKSTLPSVVDELSVLYSLNESQSIGLFMHLACLVERLLEGCGTKENKDKDKLLTVFKEEAITITKILKRLEKRFNILIDDHEVATILMIVKEV